MTIRSNKLTELIMELRKTKSFTGSMPDIYYNTRYMKEEDINKELHRRLAQFEKVQELAPTGCGCLTGNEKKELILLKQYFK